MPNRKLLSISFFLGETFFLGFGYSLLFYYTGSDAWISMILGSIIGSIFILILENIKKRQEKYPISHVIIQKIIYLLFNIFIFSQVLFSFQTFSSSFYFTKSPTWFILLPLIPLIYKLSKSGYTTIGKIGEMLFPITILLVFLSFIGLVSHIKLDSFLPILTTNSPNIIKGTILFCTYTTIPYYLFLIVPLENKKLLPKYLLSCLLVFLLGVVIISVLGPNLIRIYRYPEYMILKDIQIFNFIEKVENIVSIIWVTNLITALGVCGCNIRNCMPNKHKDIFFIIVLTILYFISLLEGTYYYKELALYHDLPHIFLIWLILLILLSFFFYKRPK